MLINKPFVELSKEEFISVYDVNFFGVIELIREILPFLKSKSQIINVSSIGGINGTSKFKGLSAYSSSKGALNILTEVLAEEFKDNGPIINFLVGFCTNKMLEQAFPVTKHKSNQKKWQTLFMIFLKQVVKSLTENNSCVASRYLVSQYSSAKFLVFRIKQQKFHSPYQ